MYVRSLNVKFYSPLINYLYAYPSTRPSQQVLVRVKHVEIVERLEPLRVLYKKRDIIIIIGQKIC